MTNAINQYAIQFSGKAPALSDQFLTNLSLCRLPAGLKDHSGNVPWHTIRIEDMDNSEELKKYSTSQLQIPDQESRLHGVLEPPSRSFRATFTE